MSPGRARAGAKQRDLDEALAAALAVNDGLTRQVAELQKQLARGGGGYGEDGSGGLGAGAGGEGAGAGASVRRCKLTSAC